jgi:hypothetical protein
MFAVVVFSLFEYFLCDVLLDFRLGEIGPEKLKNFVVFGHYKV